MNQLQIPSQIVARILAQAREGLPLEVCGIFSGSEGVVRQHFEMTNADQSAVHYTMVPQEQFRVIKAIRTAGEEMLAIYHSHPDTPARPSAEDIRLAVTPNVVYVIVSLQDRESPVIKGFTIEDGSVSEVEVTLADPA